MLTVVTGAFLAAFAVERLLGLGSVAVSAIVAFVIVGAFAWRLADGLLAFGVAILLADTVEHWTTLDLRYIDEIAIPLLIVVGLMAHRSRVVPLRPGLREAGLAVLVLAGITSSLVADVPAVIWLPGLGLLLKGFAFFYLVLLLPLQIEEVQGISGAFFVIGLAIIGIGLIQFLDPSLAGSLFGLAPVNQQRGSIQVVHSLFTHPALYGWLAVFISLFLFGRFVVLREWWALAASLGLGAASILSARRAPVLGLLVGVIAAVAHQFMAGHARARTLTTAAVLAGVIAAVALPMLGGFYQWTLVEYVEPPELIGELLSETPDAGIVAPMAPRNALYVGSVAIARDYLPLGAGIGRFGSQMSRESYSPLYAVYGLEQVYGMSEEEPIAVTDTFWPMVLGETGVIGLLAGLLFFATIGRQLWKAGSAELSPAARAFVLGAMLVFVEAMVRSLISPVFVAPPIAYFAFGTAAIGITLSRPSRVFPANPRSSRKADESYVLDAVDAPDPFKR